MLDIKLIREESEKIKKLLAKKNVPEADVDNFLRLDGEWRAKTKEAEELRAEQKKLGEMRKVEEAKEIKERLGVLENNLKGISDERDVAWSKLPNIPSEDTPPGKDENDNVVIRKWGEPPKFDFEVKDHMALGEALGLIDTERAAKVSGSRFGYIMGGAARLEFALVQFALETLENESVLKAIAESVKKGYSAKPFTPVVPPVMIRPDVYKRTARLDPGQEEERYYLPADDLYLIGSAEHTLAPLHMEESIEETRLPLRYVGFSTAFRREAGTYGKDTRGILRVHQFDKVEIESFTTAEDSETEQNFIVAIQEYLMQKLELPYQVIAVCGGDMGAPDYRQIDIETWMPGQNKYRETHSSDLVTDYQSRRLRIKVKGINGEELIHMNDATVFAVGRMLIAILENYQTADGKIRVPEVLQKYVGKAIIG